MAGKIAIASAAITALLFVVVALQPAEFAIERSAQIDAPREAVYPSLIVLPDGHETSDESEAHPPEAEDRHDGQAPGIRLLSGP